MNIIDLQVNKTFLKPEKKNGIKKGAKAESIKIAKKLLKMEMKIEEIIKATGLTKEEIEKL